MQKKTSFVRMKETSKSSLSKELYSQPPSCRGWALPVFWPSRLHAWLPKHVPARCRRAIKEDTLVRSRLGNDNQTNISTRRNYSLYGKKMKRRKSAGRKGKERYRFDWKAEYITGRRAKASNASRPGQRSQSASGPSPHSRRLQASPRYW